MWRPISLLCTDYTVLAKAMSQRLKFALPYIINRDQSYGIPGRQIFENLYTIRDVLEFPSKRKTPVWRAINAIVKNSKNIFQNKKDMLWRK